MLFLLTVCGKGPAEIAPTETVTVDMAVPESVPTETADSEQNRIYAEIIDQYHTALSENWDGAQFMDTGLNFMVAYAYGEQPFENVGYVITDINAEGMEELLIGALIEDESIGHMILTCIRRMKTVRRFWCLTAASGTGATMPGITALPIWAPAPLRRALRPR